MQFTKQMSREKEGAEERENVQRGYALDDIRNIEVTNSNDSKNMLNSFYQNHLDQAINQERPYTPPFQTLAQLQNS